MQIDYTAWKFWVDIGQWIFNFLIAAYVFISRKNQATNDRVKILEDKVVKVCADMEHMPDQNKMETLNKTMTALNGEIRELKGRLTGINRAVDLINEYLIKKGG